MCLLIALQLALRMLAYLRCVGRELRRRLRLQKRLAAVFVLVY
jgi:hypothetical protein